MTYKEAVKFKSSLDRNILKKENIIMEAHITPADPNDFHIYISDYRKFSFTDESAIEYSNNNDFKVCGLYYDGASIIFEDLTIQYKK